jgi:TRAP-type uncharacterized transport system fused permease subunit
MMAWKYTLPAFLVPFIFTVSPDGIGLLLKGSWGNIIWTGTTAIVGLGALAQDNTTRASAAHRCRARLSLSRLD